MDWRELKPGDLVKPGTLIQTAEKSHVDLVYLPDAGVNTVRMWENTLLGVDKMMATKAGGDVVTETQLDLRAGRIHGRLAKLSAASRCEVQIPTGVISIRGTAYDVSADGVVKVAPPQS
jgi:hypothetical protein